jgi:hypothetical protein
MPGFGGADEGQAPAHKFTRANDFRGLNCTFAQLFSSSNNSVRAAPGECVSASGGKVGAISGSAAGEASRAGPTLTP